MTMAGMTKAQAKKLAKKQPAKDSYQEYLKLMKRGGKSSHKRAMTQAAWMKATPRTRQVAKQAARSN